MLCITGYLFTDRRQQTIYVLSDQLHGCKFRTLGGHLQAIKIRKSKLQLKLHFFTCALQISYFVFIPFYKTEESDIWLRHVRPSVSLSAWYKLAPTRHISMKFGILVFLENL
jgi:hypothetical protein